MKTKISLFLSTLIIGLTLSCNQNQTKNASKQDKDPILTQQCYAAVYEKDSAALHVKTHKSGKIDGSLWIKYANNKLNNGIFKGTLKGDTLYADYFFATEKDTAKRFNNPLALLKKDGKLILGVGKVQSTFGRSYFIKGEPIDYDAGKFSFEAVDCR